jgi:hypothetical protein
MKSRSIKNRLKRLERTRVAPRYTFEISTLTNVEGRLEVCEHEIQADAEHPTFLIVRDHAESEAQFLARVDRERERYNADPDGYVLPPQPVWRDQWVRDFSAQEPERSPDPPRRVLLPPEETPAPEFQVIDEGRPAVQGRNSGLAKAAQGRPGTTKSREELAGVLGQWASLYGKANED